MMPLHGYAADSTSSLGQNASKYQQLVDSCTQPILDHEVIMADQLYAVRLFSLSNSLSEAVPRRHGPSNSKWSR